MTRTTRGAHQSTLGQRMILAISSALLSTLLLCAPSGAQAQEASAKPAGESLAPQAVPAGIAADLTPAAPETGQSSPAAASSSSSLAQPSPDAPAVPLPNAPSYGDGPRGGYFERTFTYRMAAFTVWSASFQQIFNETPAWGRGASGFEKRLGVAAAANIAKSFTITAVGRAMHEDPDYYRCGSGGFSHRVAYIAASEFHDHKASGKTVVPYVRLAGFVAYTAVDLAPRDGQHNLVNVGIDAGLQMAGTLGRRVIAEFWPDVSHALFHSGKN